VDALEQSRSTVSKRVSFETLGKPTISPLFSHLRFVSLPSNESLPGRRIPPTGSRWGPSLFNRAQK
jgi:hypothetical protein